MHRVITYFTMVLCITKNEKVLFFLLYKLNDIFYIILYIFLKKNYYYFISD